MKRPNKEILLDIDNKKKLLEGVKKVFDVVSPTMGAKGQNVVFWQPPMVRTTKDGVTAAIQVFLEDRFEDMGAFLAKEACGRTNINAGDGTTATCVLLYSILRQAVKLMTAGADTILLKKGIEIALDLVLNHIDAVKKKRVSNQDIKNIAKIALNGDDELSEIIARAMKKAGDDGLVTCREANYNKNFLEVIEGMQFRQGMTFQNFADPLTLEWNAEKPLIICQEGQVRNIPSIRPVVEKIGKIGRPFLLLCHECNLDVTKWLIHNMQKGLINCCVVRTPATGQIRDEIIRDFAIYTKAKVFSEYGADLEKAKIDELGICGRVVCTRNDTTIYEGAGERSDIEERVQQIRKALEDITDPFKREIYLQRIARLTASVAVVHVGGQTEVELQEKKDRVNDALQAVRAAVEEGIVTGGGLTLYHASKALSHALNTFQGDESLGIEIIANAVEEPLRTILRNAGKNPDVVVDHIERSGGKYNGYDVSKEVYTDLLKAGIVDPAKVLKEALKNSVSIALQIMQAQVGIVDKEKVNTKTY